MANEGMNYSIPMSEKDQFQLQKRFCIAIDLILESLKIIDESNTVTAADVDNIITKVLNDKKKQYN